MKTVSFEVRIQFADKVSTDEDLTSIGNNILRALKAESNMGEGLAPEASETFPEKIEVREIQHLNDEGEPLIFTHDFMEVIKKKYDL